MSPTSLKDKGLGALRLSRTSPNVEYLTYKYRLKDRRAGKYLRAHAVACNQVWNFCVATQRETQRRYTGGAGNTRWLSHFDLTYLTAGTSKELGTHAETISEVCRTFVQARRAKGSAPRFRASLGSKAARGWVPFKKKSRIIEGNSIRFVGRTFRWFGSKSRPLPAGAKGGAFVEDAQGRWWVTFLVEVERSDTAGRGRVGIDLGLTTLATLSDGSSVPALQHYRRYQARLATAQRARNKRRISRIHAKIANTRKDQHHKATTAIVAANDFIAIGKMNASKLGKTSMAKSAFDAGWYAFKSQLLYKARLRGVEIVEVNEAWTTQTCSDCGVIGGPKGIAGLGMRSWECAACEAVHDRDLNAAKNILRIGLSAQARVDDSRRVA